MIDPQTISRSIYASRLQEFPNLAFNARAAAQNRGRWREFFRQRIGPAFDGRIILEIGCWNAEFLSRIAAKYPATGYLGLDWKCKAIYDGAGHIADLGLSNIALLHARAQALTSLFADNEIDEIWLFHPDPFDREAELKNRLFTASFLLDVHRVLRDGASLFTLKTDHPEYYQWALDILRRPPPRDRIGRLLEVTRISPDFWHDPAAIAHTASRSFSGEKTAFEKRFIGKRMPIHYLELRKKS